MLMSTKANRFAHLLLKARASGSLIAPLSKAENLGQDDAYAVAKCLMDFRIAQGEVPLGRKISIGQQQEMPMWAPLFDTSVQFAQENVALHSLAKAQQPRLAPVLVFKLGRTPNAHCTLTELADCLEWMAHGFEIMVSPYRGWEFEQADAIAAFGLHRGLVVGEPRMLSAQTRRNLDEIVACASVSVSCGIKGNSALCAAGFGSDLPASPLHALWQLHQQLQQQNSFTALQAGELITTGSWTEALPVKRGEVWSSAFSQISLPGLHVSFS